MPTDHRLYVNNRRKTRRQALLDLSNNECLKCGSTANLQFDHRDRTQKSFTLSGHPLDKSWETILEEHAKCDLLCAPCHLEKSKLAGDLSQEPVNKNNTPYVHGSPRTYSETGCRCDPCKQSKRLYRAKEIIYTDVIWDHKAEGLCNGLQIRHVSVQTRLWSPWSWSRSVAGWRSPVPCAAHNRETRVQIPHPQPIYFFGHVA